MCTKVSSITSKSLASSSNPVRLPSDQRQLKKVKRKSPAKVLSLSLSVVSKKLLTQKEFVSDIVNQVIGASCTTTLPAQITKRAVSHWKRNHVSCNLTNTDLNKSRRQVREQNG